MSTERRILESGKCEENLVRERVILNNNDPHARRTDNDHTRAASRARHQNTSAETPASRALSPSTPWERARLASRRPRINPPRAPIIAGIAPILSRRATRERTPRKTALIRPCASASAAGGSMGHPPVRQATPTARVSPADGPHTAARTPSRRRCADRAHQLQAARIDSHRIDKYPPKQGVLQDGGCETGSKEPQLAAPPGLPDPLHEKTPGPKPRDARTRRVCHSVDQARPGIRARSVSLRMKKPRRGGALFQSQEIPAQRRRTARTPNAAASRPAPANAAGGSGTTYSMSCRPSLTSAFRPARRSEESKLPPISSP